MREASNGLDVSKTRPKHSTSRRPNRHSHRRTVRLTRFRYFNHLPIELRFMIWKFACYQEDRVVEISYVRARKVLRHLPQIPPKVASSTIAPAILHASSEARKIGLENYTRFLGDTFINWSVDTLLVRDIKSCLHALNSGAISQNVVKFAICDRLARGHKITPQLLSQLPRLKSIHVVDLSQDRNNFGTIRFLTGVSTYLHKRSVNGLARKTYGLTLNERSVVGISRSKRYRLKTEMEKLKERAEERFEAQMKGKKIEMTIGRMPSILKDLEKWNKVDLRILMMEAEALEKRYMKCYIDDEGDKDNYLAAVWERMRDFEFGL